MRVGLMPFMFLASALAHGESLRLALPIDCQPGRNCFVQNYMDHDPGPGYRDHACGERAYDAHNGTDFRLPSLVAMRAGVAVLAAADGVVAGVRDGMKDVSIRETGKAAVQGRECGNGLVLRHADGWETQYCHLAQGSLRVSRGQRLTTGQVLGQVGLSGMTEFPHLHLTVRHKGVVVDPFAPDWRAGQCRSDTSLWDEAAAGPLAYRRRVMLNHGFADRVLSMDELENLPSDAVTLSPDSPALTVYFRVIGLEAGDTASVVLRGPGGAVLAEKRLPPLEQSKAQTLSLIGRKRPATGWPAGLYRADYRILNDGKTVLEDHVTLRLGSESGAATPAQGGP